MRTPVAAYTLTSGNDAPERDPVHVVLSGSHTGADGSWIPLDEQAGISYSDRFERVAFNVANATAYEYYRLEMSTSGADILQVAEIELMTPGNARPLFTSTPITEAYFDTEYRYQVTAEDLEQDAMSFSKDPRLVVDIHDCVLRPYSIETLIIKWEV